MKRNVFALLLWSAILLFALNACDQATPTANPPTPAPSTSTAPDATGVAATLTAAPSVAGICKEGIKPTFIKDVVIAKSADAQTLAPVDPTQEFAPNQSAFHAVVELDNPPTGLKLLARWYLVQAQGFQPDTELDETEFSVQAGLTNADLSVKPKVINTAWPAGTYCVEVYADGNLAVSKSFKVIGASSTPQAGINPIVQIKMTDKINPDTHEPINATNTFSKTASAIYITLQIKDSPPGTVYKSKWYPPGIQPLEFTLSPGPSLWQDFHLTPGTGGFPTGDYKVEIYVNDQLVDTEKFTVQ